MSAGVFGHYAPLFAQVVRDPVRRGGLQRMTLLFLGVAALLQWGVARVLPPTSPVVPMLLAFMFCSCVALWFGAFFGSIVRQNNPAYASLVPNLHRRLVVCSVVAYVASVFATSIVVTYVGGDAYFARALLAAGVFFSFVMLAQRYALLLLLPSLLILSVSATSKQWKHLATPWLDVFSGPAPIVVALLACAGLAALGLRTALPVAGDRHWNWHRRIGRTPAALLQDSYIGKGGWMMGRIAYFTALRRDSHGAVPAAADKMMLYALGPSSHGGGAVFSVLVSITIFLLLILANRFDLGVPQYLVESRWWQLFLLLSAPFYALAVVMGVGARQGEQSLYRLAPAAPASAALNHVLARAFVVRYLLVWLVQVIGVVLLGWLATQSLVHVELQLLLAALTLPFSLMLVRDYSSLPRGAGVHLPLAIVGGGMVIGLGISSLYDAHLLAHPSANLWLPTALATLATMVALHWKWRRMVSAPVAFPAGRR